jgi:lipopolysaccharide/colanic/teichoic acid biosynthesis glycosyltransferase
VLGHLDHQFALRGGRVDECAVSAPSGVAYAPDSLTNIRRVVGELIAETGGARRRRGYRWSKRMLDIVVACGMLIVLSPLLLVIVALIKLDSTGPAMYVQIRPGLLGRPIRLLKFRSMHLGAESLTTGDAVKVREDERVTRVGRWLRAWSLDELPQLLNVLRGDMTLVGPRPEILGWVLHNYERRHYGRFLVPQGLTGWWQVTGRSTKTIYEKLEDDLYYVAHASFWLDLKVIAKTPGAILRRDGAF